MNIPLFREILIKFGEVKENFVNEEIVFSELSQHIFDLRKEKDSIGFKKNELLIEIIGKKVEIALDTIKKKRKYKEIDFQYSDELYAHIKGLLKLKEDNFLFNDIQTMDKSSVGILLENILIPNRKTSTESDLEKYLFDILSNILGRENIHRQFNIGGFLGLKSDIDVGNGKVGLELKIADNLNATEMQRVIGQVTYYKRRFYQDNLILLIAGKTEISSTLNELVSFINDLEISVIYRKSIKV
ncbi:MAG: hypothetical protein H6581_00405 [Bacteroidia bacterium]|nr:hypothetical protein [Bacteroidia bacterium]